MKQISLDRYHEHMDQQIQLLVGCVSAGLPSADVIDKMTDLLVTKFKFGKITANEILMDVFVDFAFAGSCVSNPQLAEAINDLAKQEQRKLT